MTQIVNWEERLSSSDYGLMQLAPYPVASPVNVDALVGIVQQCAELNWRVLPIGQGSSFPQNFSLRSERTFAISTSKLREICRLTNGRTYCQPGTPVQRVLISDHPLHRKTIGGFLCGGGDSSARNAVRSFWHTIQCLEVIDAKGRTMALPGPASPQFQLGPSSSILIESRGKAGIIVGIEFCADELPIDTTTKKLVSTATDTLTSPLSRQASVRSADALSLYDW